MNLPPRRNYYRVQLTRRERARGLVSRTVERVRGWWQRMLDRIKAWAKALIRRLR